MKNTHLLIGFVLSICSFCCSCQTALSPKEYAQFVESKSSALTQQIEAGDLVVQANYMPIAYRVVSQLKKESITQEEFEQASKEVDGMTYFTLRLGLNDGFPLIRGLAQGSAEANDAITNYLAYQIKEDLFLATETDTLICQVAHHEQHFGSSPFEVINLAFERSAQENEHQSLTLLYFDRLLGTGWKSFEFTENTLAALPAVNLTP